MMQSSMMQSCMRAVLPPLCLSCKVPVNDYYGLCSECWRTIEFYDHNQSLGYGLHDFQSVEACFAYSGKGRTLLRAFKFSDRLDLLPMFAKWMMRFMPQTQARIVLVPVPLTWRRQWMRRFNQSALLAQAITKQNKMLRVEQLLQRVHSQHQVGLHRDQRLDNSKTLYKLKPFIASDYTQTHIILIDDIVTTGATLAACGQALKPLNALSLRAVCLARRPLHSDYK